MAATLDSLIQRLNTIGGTLQRGLARDARQISEPLVTQAAIYPPERDGQRYVRTNTLHDGWETSSSVVITTGDGLTIRHTNPVDYAPDVQGVGIQGLFFEGRWDDLGVVARKATPAVADQVGASLAATLREVF